MSKNRVGKGDFGYLKYAKKRQLIITILLFSVSLALLIGGYLMVHTRKNWLTLVAVLGMLPASKSLVEFIMYARSKGCNRKDYEMIRESEGDLLVLYDLYFTSEKKNYPVSSMALKGKTVCFYLNGSNELAKASEKHLEGIFRQNRFEGYTIKCFTSLEKYIDRVKAMDGLEMENPDFDSFVLETILNICL